MSPGHNERDERERRLGEVIAAWLQLREAGRPLDRRRLLADHPDLAEDLAAFFEGQDRLEQLVLPLRRPDGPAA